MTLKLIVEALKADANVHEHDVYEGQITFHTKDEVTEEGVTYSPDTWRGLGEMTLATIEMLGGQVMWNECEGCEDEGQISID